MPITELILGIVLVVISLGLIFAVLMQPGKDKRLSGAIAGGADTFLSKNKALQMLCAVIFPGALRRVSVKSAPPSDAATVSVSPLPDMLPPL